MTLFVFFPKKAGAGEMGGNVIDYLENSFRKYPDKCAVKDEIKQVTYRELYLYSCRVGTALSRIISAREPVGIYMEKSADAICAMLGTVCAGGFYSVLNPELPESRLKQIVSVLSPKLIITGDELKNNADKFFRGIKTITVNELMAKRSEPDKLKEIRRRMIDTDPLYVNFTSGSTGTPKGIAVGHRSVIDFIDVFTEKFDIGETDVIANQAPFDFDVSVKDIYSAIKAGASLCVIPRRMFSLPTELMDYICDNSVTTMIWAVSALCLISTFHGLEYRVPKTVDKILFSGEVMPQKALNNFKKYLPNVKYVNLYGPTEITCNCTYHVLEKERDYSDGIPIGKPFLNEDVFLLDDENKRISEVGKSGEICVRGTALALGYYNSPETNTAHFVQNPLNSHYPELIYRTGDIGKYNNRGELMFCGRKDFQIKYLGHRIELEEIERVMAEIDGVEQCCCVFDEKRSRLRGFYVGSIDRDRLHGAMKKILPIFMIPGILRRVDNIPLTKNGKADRKKLMESTGE